MSRNSIVIGCLLGLAAVAGCRSGGQIPTDVDGGAFGESASAGGATTNRFGAGGGIGETDVGPGPDAVGLLGDLVVYFDFDRSEIRVDFNEMLAAHGNYLASNPNASVRLEGHADETGSREYNIGLGERRAQSVRRVLLLQGASADQLSTVSYGEERPAALGSDEESYQLNRRVELVYR